MDQLGSARALAAKNAVSAVTARRVRNFFTLSTSGKSSVSASVRARPLRGVPVQKLARRGNAGLKEGSGKVLLDVPGDEFGHLEHADLALAVKDWFERIVRIDHGPLFLVLASILLDVIPELLGELRARKRFGPNDRGELFVGLNGSHEGRIRFTF